MQIRPKNQITAELIRKIKEESYKGNAIWKRVAEDLNKPTRGIRVVNLSSINRNTKENDVIVVPGKVLGTGELEHKLSIAAWKFSEQSLEKIKKAGASVMSIEELIKKNPEGKNIKIIG